MGPASLHRPRVAVLSPYLPAPDDSGGRIRVARLCGALARHAELDLYARASRDEIDRHAEHPSLAPFARRHLSARPLGWARAPGTSRRVRDAAPPSLRGRLALHLAAGTYDVVVGCHSTSLALLPPWCGAPVVLDEHNIESRYAAEVDPDPEESRRLSAWEARVWLRATLVTTVSAVDRDLIARARRGPVEVVENGVDLASIPYAAPSSRRGQALLFVGSMAHRPNAEAAAWLAREVLPRVRRRHPDATLVLCGRDPGPEVRALRSDVVRVTGTVADVRPFLADAAVYANALRGGAGTSLKVIEALAAGVPMVSTRVGVRGYAAAESFARLADEVEGFVDAVCGVLSDPSAMDPSAERGRALASSLSWDRLGDRFASLTLALIEARP